MYHARYYYRRNETRVIMDFQNVWHDTNNICVKVFSWWVSKYRYESLWTSLYGIYRRSMHNGGLNKRRNKGTLQREGRGRVKMITQRRVSPRVYRTVPLFEICLSFGCFRCLRFPLSAFVSFYASIVVIISTFWSEPASDNNGTMGQGREGIGSGDDDLKWKIQTEPTDQSLWRL